MATLGVTLEPDEGRRAAARVVMMVRQVELLAKPRLSLVAIADLLDAYARLGAFLDRHGLLPSTEDGGPG